MAAAAAELRCSYLLPIRRAALLPGEAAEFAAYLQKLRAAGCEVLVVDGSPPEVFAEHGKIWRGACRHLRVDPRFHYLNGKVNGVHTGVAAAGCERIILADDDIRCTAADIERFCALLDRAEMVRPQNFLRPLPWWARMEAARMLINRAVLRAGDYPGVCAFQRSAMLRVGHYDGDVLFDNEEIVRHFARCGASIFFARDFFIEKRAPRLRKWLEQRPRQAYEDFGLRVKTLVFAVLLPVAFVTQALLGKKGALLLSAAVSGGAALLAWRGRSRDGARRFFPASVCLFAPLWIFERALSTWWAFGWRVLRGGYPFGAALLTKGIGRDWRAGARAAQPLP